MLQAALSGPILEARRHHSHFAQAAAPRRPVTGERGRCPMRQRARHDAFLSTDGSRDAFRHYFVSSASRDAIFAER